MFFSPLTGRFVDGELRAEKRGLRELSSLVREKPWLQKLHLKANELRTLQPLTQLRDLVWLDASQNQLQDALDFAPRECQEGDERTEWPEGAGWIGSNLQVALLSHNNICDLGHVRLHVNLRVLNLSHNNLESLCDLSSLQFLEELDLSYNGLNSLNGIGELGQLRILRVQENYLTNLRACRDLPRLRDLNCENNSITSLEGLEHCSSLRALCVTGNRLSRFMQLAPLDYLTNLSLLDTDGNPWQKKPFYRFRILFRLQQVDFLDGQEASAQEKVRAVCLFGGDLEQRRKNYSAVFPGEPFLSVARPFLDEEVALAEEITVAAVSLVQRTVRSSMVSCVSRLVPTRFAELYIDELLMVSVARAAVKICRARSA